jgi:hypothetical protein
MSQPDYRKPTHHPRTASRVFSGEAVVITPAENVVRMLNPVGSRIWQLADGTHSNEEIAVVLTDEFDIDLDHARRSVATFLEDLAARGLLSYE